MSSVAIDSSSAPSFKKIHYALRPRKQIERKIIVDILQNMPRVNGIGISDYTYTGLGSIHYYDFILFHKYLNISDMTSIDNAPCVNRFMFNKPFDFINFENKKTTDFLLKIGLSKDKHNLVWFDYDKPLLNYIFPQKKFVRNNIIFDDLKLVTKSSKPFDIFIITINAHTASNALINADEKSRFIRYFNNVLSNHYKLPGNIDISCFTRILQNIILNHIKNSEVGNRVKFHKLFSFSYQDGSVMYTLGGIYLENNMSPPNFRNRFISTNEENITNIDAPILTYKEKLHLDQQIVKLSDQILNNNEDEMEKLAAKQLGFEIDCVDLKSYLEYYKYYPQYYEGIL
ncbi:MAG: hypothetical protein JW771_07010 [Candidatus Thermoplasmatota archaeon]|nr:hypothetical protein [Candidatus Thermoplasmatota archaeon]